MNHDVAGDEQAGAASTPLPVQRDQALIGQLRPPGHALFHRRLGDPVAQDLAGFELQGREQRLRRFRHGNS